VSSRDRALRLLRRADPVVLLGAAWAVWAVRSTRRALRRVEFDQARPRPPRLLPRRGGRGVDAVLRRLEPSCLERSLVLQAWLMTVGDAPEVVIGVTGAQDFKAHAWLEGEPERGYVEIARVRP
jgi:hypothetical protein